MSETCQPLYLWVHLVTLAMELAKSPVFLEAGWGNAMAIVLNGAVPAAIVDSDADLGSAGIQGILKQATHDAVQGGDGCRGLDLCNNILRERMYGHGDSRAHISLLRGLRFCW